MTTDLITRPENLIEPRAIVHRTSGNHRGPVTRLMSPSDLGELVKPFIFLDFFKLNRFEKVGFAPHPHSGIATLTTFLEGSMTYGDTTGKTGSLSAGSVEWMRAGAGVWHAGQAAKDHAMRGYQLWLALPPSLELAPPDSLYLEPARIAFAGPARVLLGNYEGKASPIHLPISITFLHVRLEDEQRWTYQPSADHEVVWLAINSGKVHTGGTGLEREIAVFAESNRAIEIVSDGAAEFVIGSAAKHRYPLISGHYSVHTNQAALAKGERTIAELKRSRAVEAIVPLTELNVASRRKNWEQRAT